MVDALMARLMFVCWCRISFHDRDTVSALPLRNDMEADAFHNHSLVLRADDCIPLRLLWLISVLTDKPLLKINLISAPYVNVQFSWFVFIPTELFVLL